jgi:hypothetical protein
MYESMGSTFARGYRRFNPMATPDEAITMERELARRLRNRGYTVYGGH